MKKAIFICAAAVLGLWTACNKQPVTQASYNRGINIIPKPQRLTQDEGEFTLTKNTAFLVKDEGAKQVARFLAEKLRHPTGFPLRVVDLDKETFSKSNSILLQLDASIDVNDEGYTLLVNPRQVIVTAKTPQGLFYGMQTFLQLLPAEIENPSEVSNIVWTVPCVTVKDEPRFGYRGILLDACRHFIPTEDIKKQLDVLALFKINQMHWHLSDDQGWRLEVKKYPKLTETGSKRIDGEGTEYGGFYTQEQVREVVAYATERFITVIPEIELPGHELAAIAAYPELSCTGEPVTPRIIWGVEDIVMCAGKEETFHFLEDVLAEILPLFPGTYFHIGGDECPKKNWEHCPLCQKRIREEGLKNEEELQSYFVQRIEKFLHAHGKRIIGWDEILEGGPAPSATIMSWRGEQGGIAAAGMGHDVIMTPGSSGMYLDQYQGDAKIEPVAIGGYTLPAKTYAYNPVPDTLAKTNKSHFVKGVQCNFWSEYLYTTDLLEYRIYPRILALSEIAWTQPENKNYPDFERRIDNAYVRLDGHGIHYHIPQPEQPDGSCNFVAFTDKASLAFKSTRPVKMVYTTDGSDPVPESAPYETPIEFSTSGTLKIRSVLPSGKMSPTRTITVEKQTLSPAVEVSDKKPGLQLQTTEGTYLKCSDLQNITNWKVSTIRELRELTKDIGIGESIRDLDPYAAIASGYIEIPEDGVYYVSSDLEEVRIDGKRLISNQGETKRFSRHDHSVALAKGLHAFKAVFLGHVIGGWPSNWGDGSVNLRKSDAGAFTPVKAEQLFY
ncbi:MAG: family 20 glycosylhydrolase [Tannerella sp.]|nr:family 20 glycosylhydrolase [Tannerella sp.]